LIRLYFDVHVRRAIATGLRARDVDVRTAQEDAADRLPDPELLNRALALDRVLFSHDEDLLREAALRQREGRRFAGLIFAEQLQITVGRCINDLELIAKVCDPAELESQ
jgi:hypothetical protein